MSSKDSPRFSLVGFAVAVLTVGAGTAAGLLFVPTVGSYVGMLAGGLVAGLAIEARPTVESGLAAVLASLGLLVAGAFPWNGVVDAVLSLTAVSPVTLLVSAVLAFAVGAFGGHFGDDLRDGLTEPLPEPSPGPSSQRVDGRSTTTEVDALSSTDDERTSQRAGADADESIAGAEGIDLDDGVDAHEGADAEERADGEAESDHREHAEFELEE